ncbi:mechanosensitive ion channel family protein [Flavobacterium selenitireducens]|uniref:mechanosensitive ion channel family protein n=1 Tax=Flavobacterium selenitireducens TaxID=2722704 RepID=UPI00168B3A01|nr:mechanosensitive ion channel domain-containing protein [Flavobacterium selenitireducens]MBD3582400.1 mechanosensitive ion channel [Flavobacterium selenitireducens]
MENIVTAEEKEITSELYSLGDYAHQLVTWIIEYTPRLISALIILFIGLWVVRLLNRLIKRIMIKRELDPTLSKFLADILLWAMRILLGVTVISRLGIETSSFVAILGAMGLAVGLSLQGSLSNFAGGMLIIMFKPFRVGDSIEAQGVSGTVSEIQIFVTKLITGNNQTIFVPNGALSNGTIINYSMEGLRRGDLTFTVSYDTNIKQVREILLEVLRKNKKVLQQPEPAIVVRDLTDHAINIAVRPWAMNADFGDMVAEVLEEGKEAFEMEGISIQPFMKERSVQ